MEAELSVTEMAHNTRRTEGDQFLAVRFFLYPKKNEAKSKAAERPIFEDVEYIEIMQPGNKDSIVRRPATAMDKDRFPEHYKMWKARTGEEEQIVGTRLTDWAGITRGQAEELSFFKIKTVEQLANMADSNNINMIGLQGLKQKAVKYLDDTADEATLTRLKDMENENAAMKSENAAMRAQLEEILANQDSEEKPKRKRRTKAEMEAARAEEEAAGGE